MDYSLAFILGLLGSLHCAASSARRPRPIFGRPAGLSIRPDYHLLSAWHCGRPCWQIFFRRRLSALVIYCPRSGGAGRVPDFKAHRFICTGSSIGGIIENRNVRPVAAAQFPFAGVAGDVERPAAMRIGLCGLGRGRCGYHGLGGDWFDGGLWPWHLADAGRHQSVRENVASGSAQ